MYRYTVGLKSQGGEGLNAEMCYVKSIPPWYSIIDW